MTGGKTFHIEPPKTKQSYRKAPINRVCRTYLERQMKLKTVVSQKRPKQQNDYLFVTKFNTPLNSQIYADAIKAVIKQINLTKPLDISRLMESMYYWLEGDKEKEA